LRYIIRKLALSGARRPAEHGRIAIVIAEVTWEKSWSHNHRPQKASFVTTTVTVIVQ